MLSGCKPPSASPLGLVLLVIALSAPFWLVGAWRGGDLLPGLPVSGLTAFCPSLAAAILVHREGGRAGVAVFPLRAFDHERIGSWIWYVPILLLMPFHASCNTAWQLFPNSGSHYDPGVVAPIVAAMAAIVTAIWGPRTLAGRQGSSAEGQ